MFFTAASFVAGFDELEPAAAAKEKRRLSAALFV
jgi:hypothetical protein